MWSKMFDVVELRGRGLELGFDEGESLGGQVGLLVEDRDEVAVADDPGAGEFFGPGRVDALERRAVGRRPEDRGVEHAGQPDVAGESGLARDLGPGVGAQRRLAGDAVLGVVLDGGLVLQADLDLAPADELGVRRLFGRVLRVVDGAVLGEEGVLGDAEARGGQLEEDAAGFGRRLPQGRPEVLGAARAEGARVVGAEVRVAHDHVHRVERDVELLGQHHGQRGDDALAHLDLAGEAGDAAVGTDLEIGVGVVGVAAVGAARSADLGVGAVAGREEDDEAAAGELEELAALEGRPGIGAHRVFVVAGFEGLIALHGRPPSSSSFGRPRGRP